MSANFYALQSSLEIRHAHQVAYSLSMLGDIASGYDHAVDGGDARLARCMLDAFYVHLRLMAEFLVKPSKATDFGPGDFGVAWSQPATPATAALLDHWKVASTYVVHFGRPRVPADLGDLEVFRIGGRQFRRMATDALIVFGDFLKLLESEASNWSGGALIPDQHAAPQEWSLRLRADQASVLRAAYETAIDQVQAT